jgi:hypothetical protein
MAARRGYDTRRLQNCYEEQGDYIGVHQHAHIRRRVRRHRHRALHSRGVRAEPQDKTARAAHGYAGVHDDVLRRPYSVLYDKYGLRAYGEPLGGHNPRLHQRFLHNYAAKMREWYEKGYIYQDFASRTQDMFFMPTRLSHTAARRARGTA